MINSNQSILEGGGKVEFASSVKFETQVTEKIATHSKMNAIQEEKKENKNSINSKDQKKIVSITDQPVRSNIKPRKGVNETIASDEDISQLDDNKLKLNKTNLNIVTKEEISTVKMLINNSSQNISTVTKTPLIVSTVKIKKHKLKPTVTIGGSNVDKPIPASPTKSTPLGMPRKIDYVVPIMITIFTVPLLSVATYVLYRRGKDCWDKRHYRRMDFLIDGMYNE